jgi:hypothetical protein
MVVVALALARPAAPRVGLVEPSLTATVNLALHRQLLP